MSLRTRLFLTYALVVVVSLSLFALSIGVVLQGYRDKLVMEKLDDMARPISVQAASLLRGQITIQELWTSLEEQAQKNNIYILLANSDGDVVRQITPFENQKQGLIEPTRKVFPRDMTKPVQGIFVSGGKTFIYASYPLDSLVLKNATQVTSLAVVSPRSGILVVWASMISPSIFAGLVALTLSLIIAIFLARSVYLPISKTTEAANRIAQGNYDQIVPESGPSEIKGLAISFNRMITKVKETQDNLRQFVADVSHQLKTPLTSIQGFSQAIVDGTASNDIDRMRAARIINEESSKMRRQVEELLELARMQSGQLKMAKQPVDVGELLQCCREILEIQAEQKFISLKIDVHPNLSVPGDPDRLEQVFCNLLDNAIKNSPPKGEILIVGRNDGAGHAAVSIIDKGPGIPAEQMGDLFQRFHKGAGERTGFGLGLAIAREIVQAHGGQIEVRSTLGEGTEFIVKLPLSIAEVQEQMEKNK